MNITEGQQKYTESLKSTPDYEKHRGAKSAFKFLASYIKNKGRYMDIGCGYGSVLYFFKKSGWLVKGLELSPVFAEHVKKNLNVDVDVANFLEYSNNGEKFDLVSLRHVLEHLPDSIHAMNKISSLLKMNGYAYFEFPNINSLTHRVQRLKNKFNFLKKAYKDDYVPGHCNEFCKHSFKFLLEKTGFELLRWETYSSKTVPDFIYNYVHIGTKARALVRKVSYTPV